MQVISRVEQQPSSASSKITPKSSRDLLRTIAQVLESGKTSAHQMKILSNNNNERLGFKVEDDHQHGFDHHSGVALNAFETCLSLLTSYYNFDHQEGKIINNKRKIDRINGVQSSDHDHDHDHSSKSSEVISDANVSKVRSYKGRKTGQSWTVEDTTLIDDGYAWRKYGQKDIQDTNYPRSYYRCTNKHDQNCQATKQVQQISKNPTKYNIIYYGKHTCKNLYKTSSIIIDNSTLEYSSCFLSFDTKNYHTPKPALNSSLFPQSAFLNSTTHHDHHSCGPQKQHSSISSSSSSGICPPSSSSDLTSTGLSSTPVSCDRSDVISPPDEIYSSTSTPFEMDDDVFISLFNLDQDYHPHLDGLF